MFDWSWEAPAGQEGALPGAMVRANIRRLLWALAVDDGGSVAHIMMWDARCKVDAERHGVDFGIKELPAPF